MRPRVLLSAIALAVLVLAPVLYFHFAPAPSSAAASSPLEAPSVAPVPSVPAPHHREAKPANNGQGITVETQSPDQTHEDFIAQRTAELTDMGQTDDPQNLKTLLSELNNKDAEIRSAALAATVQFGSKDAIPALQNDLTWTEDPAEKLEIIKAIQYLELPSNDEFLQNYAGASTASSLGGGTPVN